MLEKKLFFSFLFIADKIGADKGWLLFPKIACFIYTTFLLKIDFLNAKEL